MNRSQAEKLPSSELYRREQDGEVCREVLDERIINWTQQGWTQAKIAKEIGCTPMTISRRQARLGVQPSQPQVHSPRSTKANTPLTFPTPAPQPVNSQTTSFTVIDLRHALTRIIELLDVADQCITDLGEDTVQQDEAAVPLMLNIRHLTDIFDPFVTIAAIDQAQAKWRDTK